MGYRDGARRSGSVMTTPVRDAGFEMRVTTKHTTSHPEAEGPTFDWYSKTGSQLAEIAIVGFTTIQSNQPEQDS
jgi:hypothetical protein